MLTYADVSQAEVILVMDMDKLLCDLQKEFVADPSVQACVWV
jgi:hypothetical protein